MTGGLVAGAVAVLVAAIGCNGGNHLPGGFEFSRAQPDGVESRSRRVVLIADNQIHHLLGSPLLMRSAATDRYVGSAIRPVQLDLYGQDMLTWVLKHRVAVPVIHLGDALDLACKGEFEQFVDRMQPLADSQLPWAMAPGNHDGYFFGNLDGGQWDEACTGSDGPMNKADLVRAYVSALRAQRYDPGCAGLDGSLPDGAVPDQHSYRHPAAEPAFLRAIEWRIDDDDPWESFVVQQVDLTRAGAPAGQTASAILLDTTDYEQRPTLTGIHGGPAAGTRGDVRREQASIAMQWIKQTGKGAVTVVMGHHPYHELGAMAKKLVRTAVERDNVLTYVSAHTHHGKFYVRGEGKGAWVELNVGSVLDWPPEFRTFQFISAGGKPGIRSKRYQLHDEWFGPEAAEDAPQCLGSWEPLPQARDYFLRYADLWSPSATKTEENLMETLLYSYRRLITVNPTATAADWPDGTATDTEVIDRIEAIAGGNLQAQKDLLAQLAEFEATRTVDDEDMRIQFRLCQAYWASRYDDAGGRSPDADDDFILFPQ